MIRLIQKQTERTARKYWTEEITEMYSGLKFMVKTKTGSDLEVFLNYCEIAEVVKSTNALKDPGDYELEKTDE